MSTEPHKPTQADVESVENEAKFTSYQTNRVPWQIHVMWIAFTICGAIYLIRYAIPDFIRWW